VREIATSYFGLNAQDPRLTLQVGDALQHAAEAKAQGR
jgi:spermidine synthase